jgi:hypothetical protein
MVFASTLIVPTGQDLSLFTFSCGTAVGTEGLFFDQSQALRLLFRCIKTIRIKGTERTGAQGYA